ncbi:MAG: Fic family protein [Bacteroidetes bacterium]|nr:Fic family protein [Bacteroidota bacterium]
MSTYKIELLPLHKEVETKAVLKSLPKAHAALAELKGIAKSIPNQNILINALAIQEAKDSSEIENIITTHDELYKMDLNLSGVKSLAAKEVQNYVSALKRGFALISENQLLTTGVIKNVQRVLEDNEAGFRKLPGTDLKSSKTGQVIYTPPQDKNLIEQLMANLEKYINQDELSDNDPLVKMAIIHHQFESIHPFYDGNGRTGRIVNILYLILQGLLELPVLYLSKYIIKTKSDYYRLLQSVRDTGSWEEWLIYIITGVEETARSTIKLIQRIQELMKKQKFEIREKYKFYSQDLLNNLYKHPYTKIGFLVKDLGVTRITATKYLDELVEGGILHKEKMGRSYYYINVELLRILTSQ